MKSHYLNMSNPFIRGYYNESASTEEFIEWFRTTDHKFQGRSGFSTLVDDTVKKSTDTSLDYNPELYAYYADNFLDPALKEYQKEFKFVDEVWYYGVKERINVQQYSPPGEAYFKWHSERTDPDTSLRHLVFMTYLNDVHDGGETEFFYQDISIKAEKGLTLIWPSDWTHTHRGIPSPTETKTIITGWISYDEDRWLNKQK